MDDDSLSGSFKTLENKHPKEKFRKMSTRDMIFNLFKEEKRPLTQAMIKKYSGVKSLGNIHETLINLLQDELIESYICECYETGKLYKLINT